MITATGTLFVILGLLALILVYITIIFTLKEHNNDLFDIQRKKRVKQEQQHHKLMCMGLKETGYYFNRYGLETITLWSLWKGNMCE